MASTDIYANAATMTSSAKKKTEKEKNQKKKNKEKPFGGEVYTPYPQINLFMNKSSCDMMWDLLNPSPSFKNCWDSFRSYWNTLTIARQRQIYYTIREQKNRGEYIKEHPLYAIQDCNPMPTNWNGRQGINERMKSEKMVIAKYSSTYGTYTLFEAWLFEMTDATAANFFPENLRGQDALRFNAIRRK